MKRDNTLNEKTQLPNKESKITEGWKLFWTISVPSLIAIASWLVLSITQENRDRANKLRDIKTQFLIETFKKLANAANRTPTVHSKYFEDIESSLADIQLFGTPEQVKLVVNGIKAYKSNGKKIALDAILFSLRNELRKELKLNKVSDSVYWLRIEGFSPELDTTKQKP